MKFGDWHEQSGRGREGRGQGDHEEPAQVETEHFGGEGKRGCRGSAGGGERGLDASEELLLRPVGSGESSKVPEQGVCGPRAQGGQEVRR